MEGIYGQPPQRGAAAEAPYAQLPSRLALVFCAWHALLWIAALGLSHRAPELDSAEQFVWAFSLEDGYWKHPPLPSWILHGLMVLFGPSVSLPIVATQCGIAIALLFVWQLSREWMGEGRALVATVLAALITYHGLGGDALNHTTVLLPFQAATTWFAWRALRDGRLGWWLATGLSAGLMMLVKYIALIPLAGLLLSVVVDRRLPRALALKGLAAAAAVFVVVLVPHGRWLEANHFLPFQYARSVTAVEPGGAWRSAADFVLMQVLRIAPLALAAWLLTAEPRSHTPPAALPDADARRFLWINALAPVVLMLAFGLVTSTPLQSRWGGDAFLLMGALAVHVLRLPDDRRLMQRALIVGVAFDALMALGGTLPRALLADRYGIAARANFPSDVLAHEAQATWHAHVDAPLRLVVSDIWLGGNLVARSDRPLAVLIDGHAFKSPWVRPGAIERCGALVMDDTTADAAGHAQTDPALQALFARADATGTWSLPWARHTGHRSDDRGLVRWAVIKPTSTASCPL